MRRLSLILLASGAAAALALHKPTTAVEQQNGGAVQASMPLAVEQSASGDRLLVAVMNQLERHSSVTARLRFRLSLAGHQLYGAGSYTQRGNGEDLRTRTELQLVGHEARLLQVSNARFLWMDQQMPTGRTVSRVDLRQLRADPQRASAVDRSHVQPGQATWSPLEPELLAHAGGLPSLLAALSKNFTFRPPQAMRLATEELSADAVSTTIPVFAVVGHWKPEKLDALVEQKEASRQDSSEAASERLQLDRLPQEVLLLVGQSDLFPYRVEYRRLESPIAANDDGTAIPYQISTSPMLVLELSDVSFDAQVAPGQFDYSPGEADWTDRTADHLNRLRR